MKARKPKVPGLARQSSLVKAWTGLEQAATLIAEQRSWSFVTPVMLSNIDAALLLVNNTRDAVYAQMGPTTEES